MAHFGEKEVEGLIAAFEIICDDDLRLHPATLIVQADRLFGIPCGLLGWRLYRVLDMEAQRMREGSVGAGLEAWVSVLFPLRRITSQGYIPNRGRQCDLAFAIYDVDEDEKLDLGDAATLATEVERLTQ